MIYVNSHGRMANQYFQYAMARSLQLELEEKYNIKHEIVINFGNEGNLLKHTKAKFIETNQKMRFNKIIYFINLLSYVFFRDDNRKYKYSLFVNKILNKSGVLYGPVGYVSFKLYNKKDYVIDGYFQSEKYFEKYSVIIKKELRNKQSKHSNYTKTIKKYDFENSVCMHIRRGDYMDSINVDKFLICNYKYYNDAIQYMNKKLAKPRYYVFSDDIEWVKNNYDLGATAIYENYDFKSYENFNIMQHCNNFILSNSSYSWWAQYLAETNIVIAPSIWNKETNNRDIYMENWKLIDIKRVGN